VLVLILLTMPSMKRICEHLKSNVAKVLAEWERLVQEEPWYSLPADHRIDNLPDTIIGMVNASLCDPSDIEAHRDHVAAATKHGEDRRKQGIPEHMMLTEYHLLRQAIWYYLVENMGPSERVVNAIMRIDIAITTATNASMWGYHREEIEALGKWEEGIARITTSSPLLQVAGPSAGTAG
jgi:hypothetical protein